MDAFVKLCWVLTALATVVGLMLFSACFSAAASAPQEAAAAAMAVAIVAIPYVFTRAMEGLAVTNAPKAPARQPGALDLPSA